MNTESSLVALKNAIEVYNQKKPHHSNYMLMPNQVHRFAALLGLGLN